MNHIGIYLSNTTDKKSVIERIMKRSFLSPYVELSEKYGALHSTTTIERIIDEEQRHDRYPITTKENASLKTMSSGQQRRALLAYLVEQKPDYIVLDDMMSNIDFDTQQLIIRYLEQYSKSILFIQLFFRKQDALNIIQTVLSIDEQGNIVSNQTKDEFNNSQSLASVIEDVELPQLVTVPTTVANPLIEMNAVSISYGDKQVLHNINWKICPGEFWQLKGPIGSGKSTLLSMIIGDNPKGYGQDLMLFGRKKGTGESIWDIKKQIGYFYPNLTLLFTHNDTVENMIISGMVDSIGLYRSPTDWQRYVADAWIKVLGPTFYKKRFNELSSGQQRILLVVRAIVKQPPLLILDEPTAGLDDHNAQLFINLILSIAKLGKIAILYVSHRTEPNLKPDKIFELKPSPIGSLGIITSGI